MAIRVRTRSCILGFILGTRHEFVRGNVSALRNRTGAGRLPGPWADAYARAEVLATIRSYATPIAWLERRDGRDVWVVPPVRYSLTTSQHQSATRAELYRAGLTSIDGVEYALATNTAPAAA